MGSAKLSRSDVRVKLTLDMEEAKDVCQLLGATPGNLNLNTYRSLCKVLRKIED